MAFFTAMKGRVRLWRIALLLVFGVAWPWPIAAYLGLDGYTLSVALYLSAWTTAALLAGLVWGLFARHAGAGGIVVMIAALFPWLAGAAYVLERQRVPDAACAEEVEVNLGSLRLAAPRKMGFRSVMTDDATSQVWEGSYSNWAGAKPDVRALCRVTDSGRAPVDVAHLWLSFSWFRRELETACERGAGAQPMTTTCAAAARTTPTVVQLYARPEGVPAPSLGHFSTELIAQAMSAGEREGYRCSDGIVGPRVRYCTIWYWLEPDIMVVASARLGPEQEGEDPFSDTILLLDALIGRLSRE